MAAYTTTQAGNWSSTATWGGSGPPGAGDTATITFAVTVTANTTIGAGTNVTCLSVAPSGVGTLTITGAALTIRGNAVFGANSGSVFDLLFLNPSGSTQGGIIFDGNSGVSPVLTTGQDMRIVCNGTPSGHCFIQTKSGTAGGNASITDGGNASSGYWLATYTDFTALGSSTLAAMSATDIRGDHSSTMSFSNCTFNSSGTAPYCNVTTGTGALNVTFDQCSWITPLPTSGTVGCMCIIHENSAIVAGETRLIDQCVFGGVAYLQSPRDYTITNSYFAVLPNTEASEYPWLEMDGCFLYSAASIESQGGGGLSNCYCYAASTMTSTEFWLVPQYGNNSGGNGVGGNYANNVAEWAGTSTGQYWLTMTEGSPPSSNRGFAFSGNIVFPSSTGSMSLANCDSSISNGYKNIMSFVHNTVVVNSKSAITGTTAVGIQADSITSIQANVFYNSGSSTGNYAYQNQETGSGLVTDAAPAADITNNCWLGFGSVANGTFVTVSPVVTGATTVTNGTAYYSPMSGATAPGAGDLASTNPTFADTTRTLVSWGATVGQTGLTATLNYLQANPTSVKSSLLPFVRAGYAPKNIALKGASFGGDSSSADAAGNPWPGGTPGIGAMGWASSGASFNGLGNSAFRPRQRPALSGPQVTRLYG